MNQIKNILFDLDGTIIEPEVGIINSILFALDKMDIRASNKEELKAFIGPPLIDSFEIHYGLNKENAAKAVNYYREYFSEKGIYQNTLYPEITNVLKQLKNEDYKLFIATSKPTIYAEKILEHFKIINLFEGVVGSNLSNSRKDKEEIVHFVINTYNLIRNETIMIGDRKFDIIGARKNSIKSIGVTYGHGSLDELQGEKASYIVDNCLDLPNIINSKK